MIQNEDGTKKKKTEIVAEKVTFLAQAPTNKEQQNNTKETKKTKTEKNKNK